MAKVTFSRGLQAAYDALTTKDANTIYYITDTPAIYVGSTKYTSGKDLADAISRISTDETDISNIKSALDGLSLTTKGSVKAAIDAVQKNLEDTVGSLSDLGTTAKTNLVAAINEINQGVAAAGKPVTVDTSKTTDGYLKSYEILQGGEHVVTIDIPKDLVVTAGETVEATEADPITIGETKYTTGEFLKLTIANQDAPVYINASKLVDVYKGAENATKIQIAVNNGEISASVVAGSIGTDDIAASAITTAKIADANVTKSKLATDVQTSLDKADSAVQTVESGSANGTIAVDGTDVTVTGLKSAAYTESSAYDAAGAATAVQSALLGSAEDAATANTIYGAKAAAAAATTAASTAETNAKAYTDAAVQWNDITASSGD